MQPSTVRLHPPDPYVVTLAGQLEALPPTADARTLAGWLRSIDPAPLLRRASFRDPGPHRISLWWKPACELRLLCWLPGQSSSLHHHGSSACAFRVVLGVAVESTPDAPDRRWGVGDVVTAAPGAAHQVANHGPDVLVTLHVYARPLPIDRPTPEVTRRVVVVGGGFCGVAVATHLLRARQRGLHVTLVEPDPIGRGPAYDTHPELLLNVPAGRMSMFPDDPDDFVRWSGAAPDALERRARYGAYVRERFLAALGSPTRLQLARTTAVALDRGASGWTVRLADGRSLGADELILATGSGPPATPPGWPAHPRVLLRPLAPGGLATVAPTDRVLVVGTGLTALDAVLALRRTGHVGPIEAVSRRGWWPRPHLPHVVWSGAAPPLEPATAPTTADGLAWWLAEHVAAATARGLPWQVGFDAVRPHVPACWRRLPVVERSRFLTTWRPLWEVLRHRAPAPLLAELEALHQSGVLRTTAGGARWVAGDGDGVEVELGGETRRFEQVLVCVGTVSDPRRVGGPWWDALLGAGVVTADALGLGVLTDDDGAAVDAAGRRTGPWVVGGLRRPAAFESTAVPELSRQCVQVARAVTT